MLKHADARDFVEGERAGNRAIVLELDGATLRHIRQVNPLGCRVGLLLAKCNPVSIYAVLQGRVEDQASPPATDIKKAIQRFEAQLPADQFQFVFLGFVQRLVAGSPLRPKAAVNVRDDRYLHQAPTVINETLPP